MWVSVEDVREAVTGSSGCCAVKHGPTTLGDRGICVVTPGRSRYEGANHAVPVDSPIDRVWGERPPHDAAGVASQPVPPAPIVGPGRALEPVEDAPALWRGEWTPVGAGDPAPITPGARRRRGRPDRLRAGLRTAPGGGAGADRTDRGRAAGRARTARRHPRRRPRGRRRARHCRAERTHSSNDRSEIHFTRVSLPARHVCRFGPLALRRYLYPARRRDRRCTSSCARAPATRFRALALSWDTRKIQDSLSACSPSWEHPAAVRSEQAIPPGLRCAAQVAGTSLVTPDQDRLLSAPGEATVREARVGSDRTAPERDGLGGRATTSSARIHDDGKRG